METLVFDILICWKWLGTNHKQIVRFNATLTCSIMDDKCNLQCRKLKIHSRIYRNVSFFNTLPKISHKLHGIHHCVVNLWKLCVCSIIRYLYHVKIVTGRQITIWALKQNGRKVWLSVEYLAIWNHIEILLLLFFNQSINQLNPVLLKERVRIPRTRRAGGAAMLWGRLPLDGIGSCWLFFTDDLHDNLSWVPASDKPHTFKSCFTHSSQVFFGRPGPFLPGTGLDLTLFISPLERMTCPNHLSQRSRTRMARSHIPSLACSSSIDGWSDSLTPQIQRIIARSLRHSRWRAAEVMGQVSVPCNIELRTLELNRRPLRSKGTGLDVSKGRFSRNLP